MESLGNLKFKALHEAELKELNGGKWHQETKYYPETGESFLVSYRTNLFGKIKEYGTPITDN